MVIAMSTVKRALALSPAAPQIRWNLALTQLQLRDYKVPRLETVRPFSAP